MAEKTCSDCIHKEVCENCYSYLDQEDNTKYITCHHFKSRADVVEVCRCENCKSYLEEEGGWCLEMDRSIRATDFCSYGVKRSDTE